MRKDSSPETTPQAQLTLRNMQESVQNMGEYLTRPIECNLIDTPKATVPSYEGADMVAMTYALSPGSPRCRVLIVEDCPYIIETLRSIFINLNVRVDTATNGQEAFDATVKKIKRSRQTYDLILMDYVMPFVDGPQSAKMIRDFISLWNEQHGPADSVKQPFICCMTAYSEK